MYVISKLVAFKFFSWLQAEVKIPNIRMTYLKLQMHS